MHKRSGDCLDTLCAQLLGSQINESKFLTPSGAIRAVFGRLRAEGCEVHLNYDVFKEGFFVRAGKMKFDSLICLDLGRGEYFMISHGFWVRGRYLKNVLLAKTFHCDAHEGLAWKAIETLNDTNSKALAVWADAKYVYTNERNPLGVCFDSVWESGYNVVKTTRAGKHRYTKEAIDLILWRIDGKLRNFK